MAVAATYLDEPVPEHPGRTLKRAVGGWFLLDPLAATKWAASLKPDQGRKVALCAISDAWYGGWGVEGTKHLIDAGVPEDEMPPVPWLRQDHYFLEPEWDPDWP